MKLSMLLHSTEVALAQLSARSTVESIVSTVSSKANHCESYIYEDNKKIMKNVKRLLLPQLKIIFALTQLSKILSWSCIPPDAFRKVCYANIKGRLLSVFPHFGLTWLSLGQKCFHLKTSALPNQTTQFGTFWRTSQIHLQFTALALSCLQKLRAKMLTQTRKL